MVVFNGFYIGRHGGGYDPFSFDLTDFANPGSAECPAGPGGCHAERRMVLRRRRHLPARLAGQDRAGPRKEVGYACQRQGAARRGDGLARTEVENQATGTQNVRVISTILDPSGKEVGWPQVSPPQSLSGASGPMNSGSPCSQQAVVLGGAKPLQAGDRGRIRRGP